ncbi:hypothetical protein J4466_00340 [Candidatus Pacearchaeota archaeon]|nr:hypothetical protein [Candidatus Pacearchaeota archaeon]
MDKNRIAGIYSLVISIIGMVLSLAYFLYLIQIYGGIINKEGAGAIFILVIIPLFFISLLLLFSSFGIMKNKMWGKIVSLIIYIIIILPFSFSIFSFTFWVLSLISLIGIILIILSLKQKK